MAAYDLVWTDSFRRTARQFLRRHPDLVGLFEDVLKQLEMNPHAPRPARPEEAGEGSRCDADSFA